MIAVTVSTSLGTVADLAVLLRTTIPADDPYAKMMIAQASNAVRDEAHQPGWVLAEQGDTLQTGQTLAPPTACDITLWVASRAYSHPRNLASRTAGPISETFFANGVYGLELSEGEKTRLEPLRAVGASTLPWTVPMTRGPSAYDPVHVPTSPDWGNAYIGDEDQFPYAPQERFYFNPRGPQ